MYLKNILQVPRCELLHGWNICMKMSNSPSKCWDLTICQVHKQWDRKIHIKLTYDWVSEFCPLRRHRQSEASVKIAPWTLQVQTHGVDQGQTFRRNWIRVWTVAPRMRSEFRRLKLENFKKISQSTHPCWDKWMRVHNLFTCNINTLLNLFSLSLIIFPNKLQSWFSVCFWTYKGYFGFEEQTSWTGTERKISQAAFCWKCWVWGWQT